MSIVKEVLEKQREELIDKLKLIETSIDEKILIEAHLVVDIIDDMFKDSRITITTSAIEFFLDKSSNKWSGNFSIERRNTYNFKENSLKYYPPTIKHSSSGSSEDEFDLKGLILMGKIAFHQLNKTKTWDDLIGIMDKFEQMGLEEVKPISNQIRDINTELDHIKREQERIRFESIFNLGTVKFEKDQSIQVNSNDRYSNIYSNEFFWEANPSGKTFAISYMKKCRTNPYCDEKGNGIEAEYSYIKTTINKRFKKLDVDYLVYGKIREEDKKSKEQKEI